MPACLEPYRQFIRRVDALCERLFAEHRPYLSCRKGCSECCTEISVLAVEAYSILRGIESRNPTGSRVETLGDPEGGEIAGGAKGRGEPPERVDRCAFLDAEGACGIYPLRPLICRTHGLPLLYAVLEYDEGGNRSRAEEPEWQLFYCDLNFPGLTEEEWERVFTPDKVMNMEEWNEQLVQINEWFRGSAEGVSFLKGLRQGLYGKDAQKEVLQTGRVPLTALAWKVL